MTDHEKFIAEGEDFEARNELDQLLQAFNEAFRWWEDKYMYGCNFRFEYGEDGKKRMAVSDLAPMNPITIPKAGDPRLAEAGDFLEEQLNTVLEGTTTGMIAPDISDPSEEVATAVPPCQEAFAAAGQAMEDSLRARVRNSLMSVIQDALSEGDLLLLSALGIDGRPKILDVFMEECQILKKELENESTRS